jgi:hypothetical protein
MDSLSVVVQQTDEKVTQLKEYLADGRCENFGITKGPCGEIRWSAHCTGVCIRP